MRRFVATDEKEIMTRLFGGKKDSMNAVRTQESNMFAIVKYGTIS